MPQTTPKLGIPTPVAGDKWQLVNDLRAMATAIDGHAHDERYYTEIEIDTKLAAVTAGTSPWIMLTTNGADLNTMTTEGRYHCPSDAVAKTALNCPLPYSFIMEVFAPSTSMLYQRISFYTGAGQRVFQRNRYINAWGAWVELTVQAPVASQAPATFLAQDGWVVQAAAHWKSAGIHQIVLLLSCGRDMNVTQGGLLIGQLTKAEDHASWELPGTFVPVGHRAGICAITNNGSVWLNVATNELWQSGMWLTVQATWLA